MKRYFEPAYWSVMVVATSLLLTSITGSFGVAFFLAVMMMPGVLFIKYFSRDISFRNRRRGMIDTAYMSLAALLTEYLAIIFVYWNVYETSPLPRNADVVFNPFFIAFLFGSLLAIEKLLKIRFFSDPHADDKEYVTFTSERRKVSLELDTIAYVESMDYEVEVVTLAGVAYPTRMKISQWESVLDERFMRVHRAFIVNRRHVTRFDTHSVWVGDLRIEMSRKYKDSVLDRLPEGC